MDSTAGNAPLHPLRQVVTSPLRGTVPTPRGHYLMGWNPPGETQSGPVGGRAAPARAELCVRAGQEPGPAPVTRPPPPAAAQPLHALLAVGVGKCRLPGPGGGHVAPMRAESCVRAGQEPATAPLAHPPSAAAAFDRPVAVRAGQFRLPPSGPRGRAGTPSRAETCVRAGQEPGTAPLAHPPAAALNLSRHVEVRTGQRLHADGR